LGEGGIGGRSGKGWMKDIDGNTRKKVTIMKTNGGWVDNNTTDLGEIVWGGRVWIDLP
jgi:hypothetical protein